MSLFFKDKNNCCSSNQNNFRRKPNCSIWESPCRCTILAVIAGLVATFICISVFSLLISNMDAPEILVNCMACIALCAGSFTAGCTAAKHRRKHGFFVGLGCGIVMYCAVFLIGLILLRSFSCTGTFMKFILIIICSCIGGIVGVNVKRKNPPR